MFFIFLGLMLPLFLFAEDLATACQQVSDSSTACPNLSPADCKDLLEKCAVYYDEQSAKLSADITKTSQEKKTLQNQITSLKTKVKNLETQIKQGNIIVKDLNLQIGDTQVSIDRTSSKIQEAQWQIANMLRNVAEEDKKSSIEILLEGSLSDFFSNLAYLEGLNTKVQELLESTKDMKAYLQEQVDYFYLYQ